MLKILFTVIFIFSTTCTWAQEKSTPGFVVLELFTSEGCSSCPSADELLIKLNNKAKAHGLRIYPLGFHIDYWDYLGWKDPFSQSEFSTRQQMYAGKLNSNVYTPQLVVNGQVTFVGSDQSLANQNINQMLKQKPTCELVITSSKSDSNLIFDIKDAPTQSVLNIAEVQDHLTSKVLKGENAGRRLEHTNVVSKLFTFDIDQPNTTIKNSSPKNQTTSVIGYVQNKSTGAVLCAQEFKL